MPIFSNRWNFFSIFLVTFSLISCYRIQSSNQHPKSLPQDKAIQVYFNHNPIFSYQDPYRNFTRQGENLEQKIIDAIEQAKSTVDLAVMEFRLPKVAEALKRSQKRGIRIRVVIDNKYNKALNEYSEAEINKMNGHDKRAYEELKRYPDDALQILRQSGIEIKDDTSIQAIKGSGLMHHKFLVIDEKTTIISSANLTTSDLHGDFNNFDTRGNPNNMVVIPENSQVAKIFTEEFNYMWQGLFKSHKPKRDPITIPVGAGNITVKYSPSSRKEDITTTSNGIIASYIKQAKKSVHIAVFVFSDQKISDTLGTVHDQGLKDIKVLIDPDFFGQNYSKAYDLMGVCPRPTKRNNNTKVNPWRQPLSTVGFPIAPIGDRGVHSKMAILDGVLVITGSHNWSYSGNYLNDETLIFIENSIVAAHYQQEFHRLYRTAQVGLTTLPYAQSCQKTNLNKTNSKI